MRCAALRCAILACAGVLLALAARPSQAALTDEIQVYTDDINTPGEFGLEMHVNTTPSGRAQPDYPGEVTPAHGWRVTPEFSYGLTRTWELGLYIPTNFQSSGRYDVAGGKLRVKWLPVRAPEGERGGYLGANVELSREKQRFSESPWTTELRIMAGYRGSDWLIGLNPVLGWNLSPGYRNGSPDFGAALKLSRDIRHGLAAGLEYYAGLGTTRDVLPLSEQSHTLYAVVDADFGGWTLNLGVGRGLTDAADRYTVKAIFGFGF